MNYCYRFQNSCDHCNGSGRVFDSKRVGEYLRSKRESFRNPLNEVAKRMRISAPYLSDLERGKRNWNLEKIEKFESAIIPALGKSGKTIWIYGLFNSDGDCDYVGATANPEDRKSAHRTGFKGLKFKIIKSCDRSVADKEESDLIKNLKLKGFCKFNKVSHKTHSSRWFY